MISYARVYLCKPLTKLFNLCWDTEKVPALWSDGLICPIHKKGPKTDPGNYRGIHLLSSVGKLFQIVFRNRLDHWAKDILLDNQTGFKSGYSTIDNLFVLNTLVQKFRSQKKKLYVCFVDLKKAFDYVDRTLLWWKLMNFSLSTKSLNILKSMYKSVNSCVKLKYGLTQFFQCTMGVQQGALSPLLFSLFLNDIEIELRKSPFSGCNTW